MIVDFYNWFLVFARFGAFLLALPFFSTVSFPATMRVALAALAALLLAPQLPPFPVGHLDLLALFGLLAREIAIGLGLGFFARMVFYAADIAGAIISNELGLSMGSMMDPSTSAPEPLPGLVLALLAIITMLSCITACCSASPDPSRCCRWVAATSARLCLKSSWRARGRSSWWRCKSPRRSWPCRFASRCFLRS